MAKGAAIQWLLNGTLSPLFFQVKKEGKKKVRTGEGCLSGWKNKELPANNSTGIYIYSRLYRQKKFL